MKIKRERGEESEDKEKKERKTETQKGLEKRIDIK